MKPARKLAAALAAAAVAGAASAATAFTGNDLLADMRQPASSPLSFGALRYVQGTVDTLINLGVVCPPPGVTVGQTNDMMRRWLTETPGVRNSNASVLTSAYFSRLWPCAKSELHAPGPDGML